MLGTVLVIILIIILLGGFGGWVGGPWYGAPQPYHGYMGGGLGFILVIIVLLMIFGRL